VSGGGRVVKNVAGYDLPKLHVGALGTLGVIVEATFKVRPRPRARGGAHDPVPATLRTR
jgi:glycolate oxidase FAD binding subunit